MVYGDHNLIHLLLPLNIVDTTKCNKKEMFVSEMILSLALLLNGAILGN